MLYMGFDFFTAYLCAVKVSLLPRTSRPALGVPSSVTIEAE